jgi:hypothetical protein
MHHFESNGFQFNYNSDYSGEVHIIDDRGIEYTREFEDLINIAVGYVGRGTAQLKAVRDFVAEAVRISTISRLEQETTDGLLANVDAFDIHDIVRNT